MVFSEKEINKIRDFGINIENKDYTSADCNKIENQLLDKIMNNSRKNIPNLLNEFSGVINTLESNIKK